MDAGWHVLLYVNLLERRSNDLLVRHIDVLREAVRTTKRGHPFRIPGWVVLPDHVHCIFELPPGVRTSLCSGRSSSGDFQSVGVAAFHVSSLCAGWIYPEDWVSSGDGALLPHDVWRQLLVIRRTVKLSALRWLVLPCERQR